MATNLASDLQIRWDEERRRMVVSNVHERNPPISQIIDALMAFWRFQGFTKTRWATMGVSARSLCAGFILGLPDLVSLIQREERTLWHINGFSNLQLPEKRCITKMEIVSRPTDAATLLLMEDSRVPLRLQEMLDGMDEECAG